MLTDPAGAERAAATGLPVLAVADPRGRMGELAAEIYGRPGEALLQLGITGTSGKTTTAYLIEGGLRGAGRSTGLVGTVEMRIGDERIKSERTTPEATDLQALFAVMRERGVEAVTMEVSSHALVLDRVDGCVFDVAVFNNLSPEHMEFHSDMEDYFQAKAQLFTERRARLAVVNADDEYGRRLAKEATIPVVTFSASGDPAADWRAEDVVLGAADSTLTLLGPGGQRVRATAPLPGPFNVANTVAAIVTLAAAACRPADRRRRRRRRPRGTGPTGTGRSGTAVPGRRGLRAQDGRRRIGAAGAARGHPGQAAHRPRLRRRPRHHQARPDGRRGRPLRRHRDPDLRQPALGGPPRHPRRDVRRRRLRTARRTRRRPGRRRPGRGHRRRSGARPAR